MLVIVYLSTLLVKKTRFIRKKIQIFAQALTDDEEGALQFVAGYVCRNNIYFDLIGQSSLSDKDDLIHFLIHLCGDEMDEE